MCACVCTCDICMCARGRTCMYTLWVCLCPCVCVCVHRRRSYLHSLPRSLPPTRLEQKHTPASGLPGPPLPPLPCSLSSSSDSPAPGAGGPAQILARHTVLAPSTACFGQLTSWRLCCVCPWAGRGREEQSTGPGGPTSGPARPSAAGSGCCFLSLGQLLQNGGNATPRRMRDFPQDPSEDRLPSCS